MAKLLKLRRGSTSQHGSFTGAEGEVTVDTTKKTLVVHDGSTQSGFPVLRAEGGDQNISTTGTLTTGQNITLSGENPHITFTDTNHNPDYQIYGSAGNFKIWDSTNSTSRLTVNSDGHIDISGNVDFDSGIDVTGNITTTGQINIESTSPRLHLNDTNSEDDFSVYNLNGVFTVYNEDDNRADITVASDGQIDFAGNVDCNSGLDVTGNITVSGTVDGVDVATRDTLFGSLSSSAGVLSNGVTATTQSAGDSSTKVATTAYTDTAISNLVDSSPSTLNTLNELAAALGDDANFSTTVTNNIATKMPKSGGEFTGNITVENILVDADSSRNIGSSNDRFSNIYADNLHGNGSNVTHLPAANLTGTASAINGSNITNLTAGNLTGTLPAIDGSNLTGIVSFVSGMIIMYNSATAPSGWYLCDGNNGTPDLRDRFIVGAGNSYSLNATGGSNTATDTVSISGSDTVNITVSGTTGSTSGQHTFGFPQSGNIPNENHTHSFSGSGSDTVSISGSDTVSVDTRSPYYALTFIMKA